MPNIENKFIRWNSLVHANTEKCIGHSKKLGQCPFLKVNGTDHCPRHGGALSEHQEEKEAVRNYHLTKWQARVNTLADNSGIKSLREEVGILRMILENMLNQARDEQELLMFSARASDLVMKIERLVSSCDKMEGKMGQLLGKDSVLRLAAQYVEIITEHVEDADIIDKISTKMIAVTMDLNAPDRSRSEETIDLSIFEESDV